jgi:hypothetical protein
VISFIHSNRHGWANRKHAYLCNAQTCLYRTRTVAFPGRADSTFLSARLFTELLGPAKWTYLYLSKSSATSSFPNSPRQQPFGRFSLRRRIEERRPETSPLTATVQRAARGIDVCSAERFAAITEMGKLLVFFSDSAATTSATMFFCTSLSSGRRRK